MTVSLVKVPHEVRVFCSAPQFAPRHGAAYITVHPTEAIARAACRRVNELGRMERDQGNPYPEYASVFRAE